MIAGDLLDHATQLWTDLKRIEGFLAGPPTPFEFYRLDINGFALRGGELGEEAVVAIRAATRAALETRAEGLRVALLNMEVEP